MELNKAAREAFVATSSSKTRLPSLFSLLAPSCSTKRGRQSLKQWIGRPCTDAELIEERLDTVAAIVNAVATENKVLWELSGLFQQVKKCERELPTFISNSDSSVTSKGCKLSLVEFGGLEKCLSELCVLANNCMERPGRTSDLDALYSLQLRPLQELLSRDLQPFCRIIQETIADLDQDAESVVESQDDMRYPTTHLRDLRKSMQQCEMEATAAVQQTATLLGISESKIKVIYPDNDQPNVARMGMVLRVSRQESHRVQQQSGKTFSVLRASRASGVWFSTPLIGSLGAKWETLKRSYEEAEFSLVEFLMTIFQSRFRGFLDELVIRIAELDVLVSFALVSHKHKFVRAGAPTFISDEAASADQRILILEDLYDPFRADSSSDGNGEYSARDKVAVELSRRDGKTFLLLDGDENSDHNHLGLLHLVGLTVMLNQLGCFVPCKEAVLPIFDAIYLRAGAYDQQLYGYSTFMTEMQEMSSIFSTMTPMSLVLIDDICRGTSTSEGLALALSLCFHLMEAKTFTCFASQWRELTDQLAQQPAATSPVRRRHSRTSSQPQCGYESRRAFDQLMSDCDLPPDLIDLVRDELQYD